jgi:hypothetical protein
MLNLFQHLTRKVSAMYLRRPSKCECPERCRNKFGMTVCYKLYFVNGEAVLSAFKPINCEKSKIPLISILNPKQIRLSITGRQTVHGAVGLLPPEW